MIWGGGLRKGWMKQRISPHTVPFLFLAVNLTFDCQKVEMALFRERSSVSSATWPHLIFSLL